MKSYDRFIQHQLDEVFFDFGDATNLKAKLFLVYNPAQHTSKYFIRYQSKLDNGDIEWKETHFIEDLDLAAKAIKDIEAIFSLAALFDI